MIKVEMALFDNIERNVFNQALDWIENYRAEKAAKAGGNAAPGQRVEDPAVKEAAAQAMCKATGGTGERQPEGVVVGHIGAEPEPPAAEEKIAPTPVKAPQDAPTAKQMTDAVTDAINRLGTAHTREILLSFGAGQVMKIPSEKWDSVLLALQSAEAK